MKPIVHLLRLGLCVALLPFSSFVLAASLTLERGSDSAGSTDTHVDMSFNRAEGGSLYLGVGQSRSVSGTSTLNIVDAKVGMESDSTADTGLGLEGSYWGQEDSLSILTGKVKLFANTDDWNFSVTPQYRLIRIFTSAPLLQKNHPYADVISLGARLSADYYGISSWALGVAYSLHSYDKNVAALAGDNRLKLLFSPTTLALASGFESRRLELSAGYDFSWGSIDAVWQRSISAVDNSKADTTSASLRLPADKSWQIYTTVGQSVIDTSSDSTSFTSVGLTLKW